MSKLLSSSTISVRKHIRAVYQEFINYISLTIYNLSNFDEEEIYLNSTKTTVFFIIVLKCKYMYLYTLSKSVRQ